MKYVWICTADLILTTSKGGFILYKWGFYYFNEIKKNSFKSIQMIMYLTKTGHTIYWIIMSVHINFIVKHFSDHLLFIKTQFCMERGTKWNEIPLQNICKNQCNGNLHIYTSTLHQI